MEPLMFPLFSLQRLVNISGEIGSVHIIPPQSRHFSISYRKENRLAPGLALTVQVEFIADEWRYYYDCIRIHCKGDETLAVALHASPAWNPPDFPSRVGLRAPALGHRSIVRDLLSSSGLAPACEEFIVLKRCVIPVGGADHVTVTFTPSGYGTAHMTLELHVSEFNGKARRCDFTGTCSPDPPDGKEKETAPPRASRKKRHLQSLQHNASQVMDSPPVSSVPNQLPGRLPLKAARAGLTCPGNKAKTRQEKENLFLQLVQQKAAEEEANQLRWQVHLGSDVISPGQRQRITDERHSTEREHQVTMGRPDLPSEYSGVSVCALPGRVLRGAGRYPTVTPQFDLFLNDLWANRSRALRRFQQAARKSSDDVTFWAKCVNHMRGLIFLPLLQVVVRGRVDRRLSRLRQLLQHCEDGGAAAVSISEDVTRILPASTNQILFYDFPPYPADGQVSAERNSITPQATTILLRVPHPYCDLQDELVPNAPDAPEADITRSVSSWAEAEEDNHVTTLTPPQQLLSPPDLHPLHVFNPAPGLVAFKRPLLYSETDPDHHLCPLPRYPGLQEGAGGTQRKALTREEVMRGLMSWRRFPTVSLSITLPTANGSSPRWCDPFNADLLPADAPPTLSDLPTEDREDIVPRDGDAQHGGELTPEMLRAEFTIIQDGGDSDINAQEAESWQAEEDGGLAARVQRFLAQMKGACRNDQLILD
ncbi:cilia- and flagella-associated protein 221 [Gastrophryne carolinensis]